MGTVLQFEPAGKGAPALDEEALEKACCAAGLPLAQVWGDGDGGWAVDVPALLAVRRSPGGGYCIRPPQIAPASGPLPAGVTREGSQLRVSAAGGEEALSAAIAYMAGVDPVAAPDPDETLEELSVSVAAGVQATLLSAWAARALLSGPARVWQRVLRAVHAL